MLILLTLLTLLTLILFTLSALLTLLALMTLLTLLTLPGCREQPPRGAPWVSGLVGHFVQTWPDSECSHAVQCLDCSDLNWRCNHYYLFWHGMTLLVLMCRYTLITLTLTLGALFTFLFLNSETALRRFKTDESMGIWGVQCICMHTNAVHYRVKQMKIWALGCMLLAYGYFWRWTCQCHFWVIWCTFHKIGS